MSASGYKRTCGAVCQRVRFTPESGHSDAQERVRLKMRTSKVRFTPESRHQMGACPLLTHNGPPCSFEFSFQFLEYL